MSIRVAAFSMMMILAASAQGATIFVTTTNDVVADDGQCSLREALMAIDSAADNGCSNVGGEPYGTNDWVGFEPALAGGTIALAGGELPTIASPMSLVGPLAGDSTGLTIDGDGQSRLLRLATAGEVALRNLRLVNGHAASLHGGAIWATSTDLSLSHVDILENSTSSDSGSGGGIYAQDGSLLIQNGVVGNNSISGSNAHGGGLYVRDTKLTIEGSLIEGNQVLGPFGKGGGISVLEVVEGEADVLILDTRITGNATYGTSGWGGGISISGALLEMRRTVVDDNSGSGDGGGIKLAQGLAELVNVTISGNVTTGGAGGGLHANGGGWLELTHSTVALNVAPTSGRQIRTLGVDLVLNNSLVVTADESGSCNTNAGLVATGSLATDASCGATVATPAEIDLQPLAGGVHTFDWQSEAYQFAGDCQADFGVTVDQLGQPRPGLDSIACDAGAWEAQSVDVPDEIFNDRFEQAPGPMLR